MDNKKNVVCITLDDRTKSRLDKFGKNYSISRSAVVRLIVNDFFEEVS